MIVCFVVAMGALIPLRFVEAGRMMMESQRQVLGQIVERVEPEPVLMTDCLPEGEGARLIEAVTRELADGDYSQEEARQIMETVESIEASICR